MRATPFTRREFQKTLEGQTLTFYPVAREPTRERFRFETTSDDASA